MKPLHLQREVKSSERFRVHLSMPLHQRFEDFTLFRNNYVRVKAANAVGYRFFEYADTELLKNAVTSLMETGVVDTVRVEPAVLEIAHSRAVTMEYLIEFVRVAAFEAGYRVIEEPLQPPSATRLAVRRWIERTYARPRGSGS
jgi:hypothetical protein